MWLVAVETPSEDPRTAVTLALIGLLSAMGVALVGGVFSWLVARANKTKPTADAATPPVAGMDLGFRDYLVGELAVARRRDDDNDERDDVQDRRLDQIERYLDLDNPEWRHGPR